MVYSGNVLNTYRKRKQPRTDRDQYTLLIHGRSPGAFAAFTAFTAFAWAQQFFVVTFITIIHGKTRFWQFYADTKAEID